MNDLIIQGEVQLNRVTHEYLHAPTNKNLTSVSSIIKTVYAKKSWDGVDEAIIANARERGSLVDDYLTKYLQEGVVNIPEGERQDVVERIQLATQLLEKNYGDRKEVQAQHIVYNLQYGIAGMVDMAIDGTTVVDLKNTYNAEVDWALQLGAYAWMGGYEKAAIMHISPRFYKDSGGARMLHYNVKDCVWWWMKALEWWVCAREMAETVTQANKKASA